MIQVGIRFIYQAKDRSNVLRSYVTLCVVVQQGGEKEADRSCRSTEGEVPETISAALPPSGILYTYM